MNKRSLRCSRKPRRFSLHRDPACLPRFALTLMAVHLGLSIGCQTTTHAQRKQRAEGEWRELRAGVKYGLAVQQFDNGLTEDAIATLEEAIGLYGLDVRYFVLLSRAHLERGDPAAAQQAVEQACRLAPEDAEVAYTQGTIHERSQQLALALKSFERACALDPRQLDFLVARAECLVASDRAEEAYELVMGSMDHYPRDGSLEALLAQIALVLGRDREAAAAFRIALDLVGESDSLSEQYGLLLLKLKRYSEAIAVLRSLADKAGDKAGGAMIRGLASAYLATGRSAEAKRLLHDYCEDLPHDTQGWLLLAKASVVTGDLNTTRRCADEIARLAPKQPAAFLIQGYVSWRQNRLGEARRSLESAIRSDPSDVLAHCLMGDVLVESNDPVRAREHYEKALQLDSDCRWAREALQRLDPAGPGQDSPQLTRSYGDQ